MTREEAKKVFLNRGFVNGLFDGDKWRESCIVISKWLEQEPCDRRKNHEEKPHSLLDAYFQMRQTEQQTCEDKDIYEPCDDAVEQLKKYTHGKKNTDKVEINVLALNRIIKALSQEPCDKCEVGNPCLYCKHEFSQKIVPCNDEVSRSDAIKALQKVACYSAAIRARMIGAIEELPSVTQKSAKDYLDMADRKAKKIKDALTVTQKSGYWIRSLIYENTYNCSKCGSAGYDTFNYCPNCGAKMVEPQESEDKK